MNSHYTNLQDAKTSRCPMLSGTIDYLENFLGQNHPKLEDVGHKGNVCPFTQKVLANNTVHFLREAIDPKNPEAITEIKKSLLETHRPNFFNVVEKAVEESKRKLACLLIIIHGLQTADECNTFISNVQKDLQPDFVQKGLLLSELHPYSSTPSARNEDFFPSRPPFPLFFIRRIIPNDIPYLLRKDRYSDEIYTKILSGLLEDFDLDVIKHEMHRLGKEVDLTLLPKPKNDNDDEFYPGLYDWFFPW